MRLHILWITVFGVTCIAGCTASVTPHYVHGDFSEDPVTRAANQYLLQAGDQPYDIGIALYQTQTLNGTSDSDNVNPSGGIAFELDALPAQVISAQLNGINLPWIPENDPTTGWNGLYHSHISALNSFKDSLTFSYQGFSGESYSATVPAAPGFGAFTYADTISASQGFHFHYPKTIAGDTIGVNFYGGDTGTGNFYGGNTGGVNVVWSQPDTGGFIIQPNQLLYYPKGKNLYFIGIGRVHWQQLISPDGKRIGIYSWTGINEAKFYTKP